MDLGRTFFPLLSIIACFLSMFPTKARSVDIYGNTCEKVIAGESKSSTRVRASDKAVFLGVKKIDELAKARESLNEHDINVLVYRLVDEHVEDLSVNTTRDEEDKICVEIKGWVNPQAIAEVEAEFIKEEVSSEVVASVASNIREEMAIKPDNPENLALLHITALEYFNGTTSVKYVEPLKKQFFNNPYFYLTDDAEIADYIIRPKVLKAKVDKLDAGHKRLQMVVNLEISGLKDEVVNEYQNRFVLFGAEENEQQTAARLLKKLINNAGDGALRKIEHNEQKRLEKSEVGRILDEQTSFGDWSF